MRRGMKEEDWLAVGFQRFKRRSGQTAYTETSGVWRDVGGLRLFVTGSCMFSFPQLGEGEAEGGDCHVIVAPAVTADASLQAVAIFADERVAEAAVELAFNEAADAYAALCLPGFNTKK